MKKLTLLLTLVFITINASANKNYTKRDKKNNHAFLAEKARTNVNYKKMLKIAEDYNLAIGIRKFKLGYYGKTQNIRRFQGQYRWNFLTDRDDPTETFCFLFVTSKYRKLRKWMKSDKYLKAKVTYLIESLNKISLVFSDEYFENIHSD